MYTITLKINTVVAALIYFSLYLQSHILTLGFIFLMRDSFKYQSEFFLLPNTSMYKHHHLHTHINVGVNSAAVTQFIELQVILSV